jgi:hypothetical protein
MTLQEYILSNPLPPGTTKFGQAAQPTDAVYFLNYGAASEIVNRPGGYAAAVAAMGITTGLPPGLNAPQIMDGGATGDYDFYGYPTPSNPPLNTDEAPWVYRGYFITSVAVTLEPGVILPAGALVFIDESIPYANARELVSPRICQMDRNVVQEGSGATAVMVTVETPIGLQITQPGGGIAIAQGFMTAPA